MTRRLKLALMWIGLGVALVVGWRLLKAVSINLDLSDWMEIGLGAVAALALIALQSVVFKSGFRKLEEDRRAQQIDGETLLLDDGRPYFLYLRAFTDDNARPQTARWYDLTFGAMTPDEDTYEKDMVFWIGNLYGPVVAVGEPGTDALPPEGAGRMYFEHHEWREAVLDMMRNSSAVVMRVAAELPPGLSWEIEQTTRQKGVNVVFILPDSLRDAARRQALHAHLWAKFEAAGLAPPAPEAGAVAIALNKAGHVQQFHGKAISWPFTREVTALEQAFQALGVEGEPRA